MRRKGFVLVLVIILAGVAILALFIYLGHRNDILHQTETGIRVDSGKNGKGRPFTKEELVIADTVLSEGIIIDDPQYDWYKFPQGSVQGDGRPDNSSPYPLPWTDLRSVSVGTDQNYIYFKFRFWGPFPKEEFTYNGDAIKSSVGKITSFTFIDSQGKTDSADLGVSVVYGNKTGDEKKEIMDPFIGAGAMISPQGIDATSETIFKIITSESMAAGGPGTDYLICAFPLRLFNLKLGDSVTFDSSTETGSLKFHHEALDLLLGYEGFKFGDKIKYVLGSDKFEIIQNADYSSHS